MRSRRSGLLAALAVLLSLAPPALWAQRREPPAPRHQASLHEPRQDVGRYRMRGALAGAAAGALGYYFTVYQSDYCRDPDMFPCEPGFAVYALGGAVVGALVGHFVGKATRE